MVARWRFTLALAFTSSLAVDASAFCRSTTCDKKVEQCVEIDGCVVEGLPLAWPTRCVSFGTQQDGARGILYEQADRIFRHAFQIWANVDCGGGNVPSFQVWALSQRYEGIVCDRAEFNRHSPNASVWMFREDEWVEDESALAITTVLYERSTGAILDADVEFNAIGHDITIGRPGEKVAMDLASIALHEAGHFLGLGHASNLKATMFENYKPGTVDLQSLHRDDEAGICAAYPPDRDVPSCDGPRPPNGFSRYCGNDDPDEGQGCTVRPPEAHGAEHTPGLLGLLGLAAVVGLRRHRSGASARLGAPGNPSQI